MQAMRYILSVPTLCTMPLEESQREVVRKQFSPWLRPLWSNRVKSVIDHKQRVSMRMARKSRTLSWRVALSTVSRFSSRLLLRQEQSLTSISSLLYYKLCATQWLALTSVASKSLSNSFKKPSLKRNSAQCLINTLMPSSSSSLSRDPASSAKILEFVRLLRTFWFSSHGLDSWKNFCLRWLQSFSTSQSRC